MKDMKHYNKNFATFLTIPAEMLLLGVVVECVILGFNEGEIKVLLNRYKSHRNWMLPGGFVYKEEGIYEAASRLLGMRTGLKGCYLHQFAALGEPELDKFIMEENKQLLVEYNIKDVDSHWMISNRFVSIDYYAYVNYDQVKIKSTADEECDWFSFDRLPSLFGNHQEIINKAIHTQRMEVNYIPAGLELLPEKFTMSELRVIYEAILGRELDRRNFQRKVLSYGYVYKLDEISRKWGIKDAALFSFNKEKYLKALENGLNIF
jgi:ADP-ribose pyrophosphatase YjhB (NUDIX family)